MYDLNLFSDINWFVIEDDISLGCEECAGRILASTTYFRDATCIIDSLLNTKKGLPLRYKIAYAKDELDPHYSFDLVVESCELGSFDYSYYLDWCSCKEDLQPENENFYFEE